jgi:type IX secretion system PorP/SprF family membrane protein
MQSKYLKCHLLILAVIFSGSSVSAQQLLKVSNYMDHNFINNPAAVGAHGNATFGALYRSQWSGIEGGPKTAIVFGDTYFSKMNTGLGVVLYSDKTGPTSRTGGEVNLSYSIKLDAVENKRVMIGLGAQMIQFRVDKNKIADAIPNDPLLASSGSNIKGDANAGVYFRSNTLNVGFSAKQLVQPKLNFIKTATNPEGKLYRHYMATAYYNIRVDETNVLQPHAEVRFQPNAPTDYEGGITLYHRNLFHIGGSYHYKQAYTLFAGLKLMGKFSINYAYDVYNSPISTFETGNSAHEIMLRYFFIK